LNHNFFLVYADLRKNPLAAMRRKKKNDAHVHVVSGPAEEKMENKTSQELSAIHADDRSEGRMEKIPAMEQKPASENPDLRISEKQEEELVKTQMIASDQKSESLVNSLAKSTEKPFDRASVVPIAVSNEIIGQTKREVLGDSGRPLIDLSTIDTVGSVAFAEGDPADRISWKTSEYYHFAKNQELKELIR
jgi:hypothetical protein